MAAVAVRVGDIERRRIKYRFDEQLHVVRVNAAVAGMDDPLCGGIPSSPAGTPYPEGLDQLNMCLQSNTLGEFPATPASPIPMRCL